MTLRGLTHQQEHFQGSKSQLTNQLHALLSSHQPNQDLTTNLQELIDLLSEKIEHLHKTIVKTLKEDILLNQKWENVKSIPGIAE